MASSSERVFESKHLVVDEAAVSEGLTRPPPTTESVTSLSVEAFSMQPVLELDPAATFFEVVNVCNLSNARWRFSCTLRRWSSVNIEAAKISTFE
jgi:hypothetical protein